MSAGVTFDLDALNAIADAQRRVPDVLRARMTSAAERILIPAFRAEMRRSSAPGQAKRMIIPGSYADAGFAGYSATAGVSGESLSGGGTASQLARAFEFGTNDRGRKRPVRRRDLRIGSTYFRNTTAQLPPRRRKGWVFYPAMARLSKRAIPLYVQVAVLTLANALEGKS
jgi:hypothetical protein